MDLQDFSSEMLYFQKPMSSEVEALVSDAANNYGEQSEYLLLKAKALAPDNLVVLVGLYRFYYYQHRYTDALDVASDVMAIVGREIGFPQDWQRINSAFVANGVVQSFCLVRLYFFALKAAGYVNLRLANFAEGKAMIEKVVSMDTEDRMGARLLLEVLKNNTAEVRTFPVKAKLEACS